MAPVGLRIIPELKESVCAEGSDFTAASAVTTSPSGSWGRGCRHYSWGLGVGSGKAATRALDQSRE